MSALDLFAPPIEKIAAISLWQPHASLMFAFLDGVRVKPDETRHWAFPARLQGKRVVIHAAQRRVTRDEEDSTLGDLCAKLFGPRWRKDLPYGAFLGDVLFERALRMSEHGPLHELDHLCGYWTASRWAWRTSDPRPLATPVPAKGQQGFWEIPLAALSQEGKADGALRVPVEFDQPMVSPEPPWPVGPETNAKREGWAAFFAGRDRERCPFPPARADLQRGYREGWEAAAALHPKDPDHAD